MSEGPMMDRRDFIKGALTASSFAVAGGLEAAQKAGGKARLIDVNVNLSRWPTRRLRENNAAEVAAALRDQGVVQAWVGSLDGLFHKDVAEVNARLADECRRYGRGLFVPFGTVNPKSPDWEEDLRRCVEQHRMRGIRLHPNYHGYKLDDPEFARLLRLAADRELVVQLALVMEDERMMHPLLRVEVVDPAPLTELIKQTPGTRMVLLNAMRILRSKALTDLILAGEVCVEISMLEGVGGVGSLLDQMPVERVLFGSHAPLYYFESSLLKLKESPLAKEDLLAISYKNAERILAKPR